MWLCFQLLVALFCDCEIFADLRLKLLKLHIKDSFGCVGVPAPASASIHSSRYSHPNLLFSHKNVETSLLPPRGWLVAVSWPRWGPARASRMTYIFIPSSADRVMTRDASLSPDAVYTTTWSPLLSTLVTHFPSSTNNM